MKDKVIVAKTFVINPKGLILTLRRSNTDPIRPLTWDLPGGEVEYGEDPTEAVIREAMEEVGLKIENPQIFRVKTTNRAKYVIRLLYYVYADSEKIKLSYEHYQYKWVTKEAFSKLDIPEHYLDGLRYLP
ncbi:MAG TPA: NUDIX domain-containing protein [Candidatus Saccharimonadales bacterium]|nr:NUDIX domain-containing protein [Candidatus Saccharimonadales bacterium]